MAFDFRKEYKEFYLPKNVPSIVTVPPMNYLAVRGEGDPNQEGGAYQQAIGLLYGIAYTIKMSKKGDHRIEGYFDYVVPPLEGFWQQGGRSGHRLRAQREIPMDLRDPAPGLRDPGGLRLGGARSSEQKENGLFVRGVLDL